MKILLLFSIALCGSFTVYAILASRRNKKYSQAIVLLMMTLALILYFFDLLVFGTVFIIAGSLILLWKSSENRDLQRESLLKDFRSIDDTKPLAVTDFLSWKSWGKISVNYGAKKAAILYSLFNAIILTILFYSLIDLFEDISETSITYSIFILIFTFTIYFVHKKLFEQTLLDMNNDG